MRFFLHSGDLCYLGAGTLSRDSLELLNEGVIGKQFGTEVFDKLWNSTTLSALSLGKRLHNGVRFGQKTFDLNLTQCANDI